MRSWPRVIRVEVTELDRRALAWQFGEARPANIATVVGFIERNGTEGLEDVVRDYEAREEGG